MIDDTRLGPFTVDQKIGEGGMGAVYRGTHRETDVPVAIKVIHREAGRGARDRFHEEVQAHAGLQHPGIVYLFEYGEVDKAAARVGTGLEAGSPFVAMELADRGTVRDRMPAGDRETVCRLLVQILDGLAYAHARGVVHRDLKPENFLLFDARGGADGGGASEWRVKLADFGIAHAFDREHEADTTELEVAAGTPLYMAPEQLHGRWREFGPWTDLYAVGCIAWELVCGRPPYDGGSAFAIANKHQNESPPRLDPRFPVPDELEGWIHRAMAADPDRRFQRAADAAWALPRGVMATGAGPERVDSADATSPEPTDEQLAETQLEGLTATIVRDETPDDDAPAVFEEAPTRTSCSDGGDQLQRAETAAAVDAEGGRESVDGPDRSGRLLQALHPPLPSDWRPEYTDPIPAPLVGAGLGLFGLREPPFVDRREACDHIWQTLGRVIEHGVCESVFVAGEAGTGKSRLAEWMTVRAHEVGAAQTVRAVHTPEGGPSEGLRGALDRRLRTLKMDRSEVYRHLVETMTGLASEDDDLAERDARALTEYLRPTDDESAEVDGPRYRFTSPTQKPALLVRTLGRLAARRPVILWLDDLQWGPEALGVLEHLDGMPGPPPTMLVLATVRSDVVAEQPRLAERLERLRQGEGTTTLPLEPLSRDYQRQLLDGLLPLEPDLADRLADRTEGHPLFAMQLLRHWIDGGNLEVGSQGFQVVEGRELELPSDIHQLWMERVDRLRAVVYPGGTRRVLEALELAAALGRQVDIELWSRLLDETDLAEPEGLADRLVEWGLAERTADGWAFAHGLLVDSLARRSREAGRWEAHHRRSARVLEETLSDHEPGPRERIAEHWVSGGRPEAALEPLIEELKLVREFGETGRYLLERRRELLDELEVSADDPRRLEQRIRAAKTTVREGKLDEGLRELKDVWERLDDDAPRLQALCAQFISNFEEHAGHRQCGRTWAERAVQVSRRTDDTQRRAQARRHLAVSCFGEAEFERAEPHIDRAVQLAEQSGDLYEKLQALRMQAVIRMARGDESAGEVLETIRRRASELGYVELEALASNGLGEFARFDDRLDEARRHYRTYLQATGQLADDPIVEVVARLNLGQVALRTGDLDGTRRQVRSAEQLLEAMQAETRRGLFHLLRLGHAAGTADRTRFEQLWARLADGWPEEWRLIRDHPWLLETIGEYPEEAGWEEKAREVWQLGAELWEELGDEEAAERLREMSTG